MGCCCFFHADSCCFFVSAVCWMLFQVNGTAASSPCGTWLPRHLSKRGVFWHGIDMLQLTCFRFDPVVPWSMIHLYWSIYIHLSFDINLKVSWATHQFGSLVRPAQGFDRFVCYAGDTDVPSLGPVLGYTQLSWHFQKQHRSSFWCPWCWNRVFFWIMQSSCIISGYDMIDKIIKLFFFVKRARARELWDLHRTWLCYCCLKHQKPHVCQLWLSRHLWT